jgi:hypothetical protein
MAKNTLAVGRLAVGLGRQPAGAPILDRAVMVEAAVEGRRRWHGWAIRLPARGRHIARCITVGWERWRLDERPAGT